jgi:hypothetical protein
MEATRERPFQYLVCRGLDPQTRKRVIKDLENISRLLGEFKIQIERKEMIKGMFYLGTLWITDWYGGVRAAKVHPLIIAGLPEATRIMQVTRN